MELTSGDYIGSNDITQGWSDHLVIYIGTKISPRMELHLVITLELRYHTRMELTSGDHIGTKISHKDGTDIW